jgi:hypothetical protein
MQARTIDTAFNLDRPELYHEKAILLDAITGDDPFIIVRQDNNHVIQAGQIEEVFGIPATYWVGQDLTRFHSSDNGKPFPSFGRMSYLNSAGRHHLSDFELITRGVQFNTQTQAITPSERSWQIVCDIWFLNFYFGFPCRLVVIKNAVPMPYTRK